jgi:hypothetical protein
MTEQTALLVMMLALFLFVLLLGKRLMSLERRLAKLTPIEAKLDLLLKSSGVEYDPYGTLPHGVREAIEAGRKIEAIKHYRAATSVSLGEAKSAIEEIQRRVGL